MFNSEIKIQTVDNGYIVTVIIPERLAGSKDFNKELSDIPPIRQFVCYQWYEVLQIIEENKIFP